MGNIELTSRSAPSADAIRDSQRVIASKVRVLADLNTVVFGVLLGRQGRGGNLLAADFWEPGGGVGEYIGTAWCRESLVEKIKDTGRIAGGR